MKRLLTVSLTLTVLAAMPLISSADLFFSDDFSTSSVNQVPVAPTATSTSYEVLAAKNYASGTPSVASGDLKFGIVSTTGGIVEVQALFTSSPATLVQTGDYIEMTVVFTNTAGLLTANGFLGFGLYNSQQVFPLAGGLTNTLTSGNTFAATGGAQNWQGYVGQIGYTGNNSRIMTRPAQTGTDNRNQDLVTSGSGSQSYLGSATVGSTSSSASLALTAGQTYTEVLRIDFVDTETLAITNSLYDGAGTGGTLLSQVGGQTSGSTFLTSGFDALAVGWYEKGGQLTTMDISSIQINGHATPVTGPPVITSQPSPVTVPAGAACDFAVEATGYSMTYQWHRYGTNLLDGGNISGANSSVLVISPASAADVASGANGYYVTITGAGGYSTNSTTNSLTLGTAGNLVWSGSGSVWDLNTTADWLKGATPSVFNFGDNVTFNDTGLANSFVTLSGNFLSASSVTVDSTGDYIFDGTGSFAGPGQLRYVGAGHFTLNNANTYTGGTLISNSAAYLILNNYHGLGTGPVTLAKAGGQMEVTVAGNASTGIGGDIVVADDFNITYDAQSAYGLVFLGNLGGTAGKTLTLTYNNAGSAVSRIRVFGDNTVCEANLNLVDSRTVLASYHSSGSQTYNGIISGSGAFMEKGKTTYLNGDNTYSGGTFPATGYIALGRNSTGDPVSSGPIGTGPLMLAPDSTTSTAGSGGIMAWGGARTIANPVQYPTATNNQTLIIGGDNDLILSGAITLNGNDGVTPVYTSRIFEVTNTALTTFSGVISDGGFGFGLTKTGNGILALSNAETYTGPTAVSNGTLRINGSLAGGAVTVATNGTLGGTGTIAGPVTVLAGGAIAPGASIGTLTINNNLALSGNLFVEVNKALSPTSDKVVVSGTLNNAGTGTLTVTNIGATALAANDTFTIFNKAVGNGAAITVTGMGATWANNLAVDGTIKVVSVIPTAPTNITATVSGGELTLSWPANYTGWALEAQTNSVSTGLSSNWVRIDSSTSTNQVVMPVNPANGSVFFRLVYP